MRRSAKSASQTGIRPDAMAFESHRVAMFTLLLDHSTSEAGPTRCLDTTGKICVPGSHHYLHGHLRRYDLMASPRLQWQTPEVA